MTTRTCPPIFKIALILPVVTLLAIPGCVSSARYRIAVAEQEHLAKEILELKRTLAEERVRALEALEAVGRRPDQDRGAASQPVETTGKRDRTNSAPSAAIAPEGLSAPTLLIADEDVTAPAAPGTTAAVAEGLLRVARSYSSAGKSREAIDAYTRLVTENPFSPLLPQAFLERGRVRLGVGDRRGALEDFDTVTEAFPTSPQASEARRERGLLRH